MRMRCTSAVACPHGSTRSIPVSPRTEDVPAIRSVEPRRRLLNRTWHGSQWCVARQTVVPAPESSWFVERSSVPRRGWTEPPAFVGQQGAAVPAVRHATQARAAWMSLNRRGWASDYSAALLTGLPVPYGQSDRVTISQATRPEGRRAYRPDLRLRTAQVEPCDIGIDWGMAVLRPGH